MPCSKRSQLPSTSPPKQNGPFAALLSSQSLPLPSSASSPSSKPSPPTSATSPPQRPMSLAFSSTSGAPSTRTCRKEQDFTPQKPESQSAPSSLRAARSPQSSALSNASILTFSSWASTTTPPMPAYSGAPPISWLSR